MMVIRQMMMDVRALVKKKNVMVEIQTMMIVEIMNQVLYRSVLHD